MTEHKIYFLMLVETIRVENTEKEFRKINQGLKYERHSSKGGSNYIYNR